MFVLNLVVWRGLSTAGLPPTSEDDHEPGMAEQGLCLTQLSPLVESCGG